ncbi:hypothetical protein GCM10010503_20390 [Streptomyces lucensis JCM 4490]|uniref:Uncharacterized protein n=1 Tax=Streptomyces lucensis JCM 4490 TaxID=1306176 RepID=A0A918MPR2_9ACTN|nr:hypothetical protein GCM10010503_20390 [Streptomyces lucensis JCM 4490]
MPPSRGTVGRVFDTVREYAGGFRASTRAPGDGAGARGGHSMFEAATGEPRSPVLVVSPPSRWKPAAPRGVRSRDKGLHLALGCAPMDEPLGGTDGRDGR